MQLRDTLLGLTCHASIRQVMRKVLQLPQLFSGV